MLKHLQCLALVLTASCIMFPASARAQLLGIYPECSGKGKAYYRECAHRLRQGGQPPASREEPPMRATPKQAGHGSCAKLPGVWEWFMGGDVTINSNGTVHQPSTSLAGAWTCSNGQAVIRWSFGITDTVKLSGDGNHLTGGNGLTAVWGNRRPKASAIRNRD